MEFITSKNKKKILFFLIYTFYTFYFSFLHRVFLFKGVYDLYETGYRDSTAITASIASKLVSQRNEINITP